MDRSTPTIFKTTIHTSTWNNNERAAVLLFQRTEFVRKVMGGASKDLYALGSLTVSRPPPQARELHPSLGPQAFCTCLPSKKAVLTGSRSISIASLELSQWHTVSQTLLFSFSFFLGLPPERAFKKISCQMPPLQNLERKEDWHCVATAAAVCLCRFAALRYLPLLCHLRRCCSSCL